MELVLVRHGNTFDKDDKVVWVGAGEDLPLTAEGRRQAAEAAARMKAAGVVASVAYCGPLRRTREAAEILRHDGAVSADAIVDGRLLEIDYGGWSGLTDEEVAARFGRDELDGWVKESRWPASGVWRTTEAEVVESVRSFASDLESRHGEDDTVVVVSSNGVLRYFLTLVDGAFARTAAGGGVKVKTGNVCRLRLGRNPLVSCWNAAPSEAFGPSERCRS